MLRESATTLEVLFNIILYGVLLYLSHVALRKGKCQTKLLLITGIILFCAFSFWGADYFHYLEIYSGYRTSKETFHVESIYYNLILFAPSYLVYRLIIWGGAFSALWVSKSKMLISNATFLFFFVLVYLLRFSYARASLAMAILFLGYVLINNDKNRLISLFFGMSFIAISFLFHRSIVLAMAGLVFSFFIRNRITAIIAICILPLVFYVTNNVLYDYIVLNSLIENEDTLSAFNLYTQTDGEVIVGGLGERVGKFLEEFPVYLTFFILFYQIVIKKIDNTHITVVLFSSFMGMLYVATAFYFITPIIYRRVLFLTMLPLAFLLARIYPLIKGKKYYKYIVYSFIISQSYCLIYSFYCTF